MNAILAAARADFLQRVRSFRFLAVLMATVTAGMLMLPTAQANYEVLQLGNARGIYGSAWVGLVFGVVGAVMLPLFGFFVVKDAVARDRSTRVGLMLAASPFGRSGYLAAKFLSNAAIFVAILAVSSVVAFAMQIWRAEDLAVHPIDLLVHLWAVPLPVVLVTSALALMFECVPGLRGAFGNVVFFFVWAGAFASSMTQMEGQGRIVVRGTDFYGISAPLADFEDHLNVAVPGHKDGLVIGTDISGPRSTPIPWPGIAGDAGWLAGRALWLLAFAPLLLIAALCFDRFDPARGRRRRSESALPEQDTEATAPTPARWHALTSLPKFDAAWRPTPQLKAELSLLLKRRPWWWYGVVAVLWIVGLANSASDAVHWVVPLAWLWGLTAFSEHGARAQIHGTGALLTSAPAPLLRQLPVQWLAAFVFALMLVAPVLLKLALVGTLGVIAQIAIGAGFVSALALALGAISGGSRLFELVFLMLWYAAIQNAPGARFTGSAELAFARSDAPIYLVLAAAMLVLAWMARATTMRR